MKLKLKCKDKNFVFFCSAIEIIVYCTAYILIHLYALTSNIQRISMQYKTI